jgi:AraC-like DNA-binding protein
MMIVRKSLSTESFDKRLGNRQRFMQFSELFEHFSNTGEFDPAEDALFKASMNSIAVGTTLLGRCRGTFRTVRREKRQVLATNDDRYCFARNAEAHDAYVVHRGKKFRLRPDSMAILKLDETFSGADGTSYKRFTNVYLPSGALQAMVANVDDMVGVEFAPGGALTLAMDYSDLVLANDRVADEAGTQIASHILDLVAIGLGARRDAGEMAGKRGLRAVRLTHVLNILQRRFTEADFSAHALAAEAGLSERYINELLYEAGASFSARLLELRLRKAIDLLAQPGHHRIGDIAFACGFNDLSYFNRCFRRRFGLTPIAARGPLP